MTPFLKSKHTGSQCIATEMGLYAIVYNILLGKKETILSIISGILESGAKCNQCSCSPGKLPLQRCLPPTFDVHTLPTCRTVTYQRSSLFLPHLTSSEALEPIGTVAYQLN